MYLNLLILCGILLQVIIGNFADQEIRKSSDIVVRQKRVISRIPSEDRKLGVHEAPYIVQIKHNSHITCVGSILSHHIVITITLCVRHEESQYLVSTSTRLDYYRSNHNVTDIKKYYGIHPGRSLDGIALLTVVPPFAYGPYVNNIELHSGPLLPDTFGTVYGWGFDCRINDRGTNFPRNLRSIEVAIMRHRQCVDIYRPHNIAISEKDICTFYPQRHCGHSDGGAPLVIDGELAGVHLWTGPGGLKQVDPEYPDVFAVVQHTEYNQWIRTWIKHVEALYQ